MHSNSPTPHKKARIEIIPLIDIMFFLLASFMLVSLSLVKLQGARVDLPSAAKPPLVDPPPPKPDIATVFVEKDGNCLVGEKKTPLAVDGVAAWATQLRAQKGDDAKVFITGDPTGSYGSVLAVLDRIRRGGLTKVTFNIKAAPTGAPSAPAAPAAPAAAPAVPVGP